MDEIVEKHRSILPHVQLTERIIFLTWRLAFTLPRPLLDQLAIMRDALELLHTSSDQIDQELYGVYYRQVEIFDLYLGQFELQGLNLCKNGLAEMIAAAFRFYDDKLYELHGYCVMPNHIHLLIRPLKDAHGDYHKDSVTVQRLKSYTARQINQAMGHAGKVWTEDYFDRFIRNPRDYWRVVEYILDNPLKAGLSKQRDEWPYAGLGENPVYRNSHFWNSKGPRLLRHDPRLWHGLMNLREYPGYPDQNKALAIPLD